MKKLQSLSLIFSLFISTISNSAFALDEIVKQRDINDTISQENLDYPFYDSIKWGYEAGIFDGYSSGKEQGKFVPENLVTRAEFLAMLFKVLKLNIGSEYDKKCFKDSNGGVWYNKYLCYSKEKGFVNGYGDGTFKPNDKIRVYEAVAILYNSFGIVNNTKITKNRMTYYLNSSSWYYEKFNSVLNNGIVYNNSFYKEEEIGGNLKRGEMINLLFQFYGVMYSKEITEKFLNNLKDKKGNEMFSLLDTNSQELETDSSRYQRIVSSLPIYITSIKYKGGLFYNGKDYEYTDSKSQKYNRRSVGNNFTIGIKLGSQDSNDLITKDIKLITTVDSKGKWLIHIDENNLFDSLNILSSSSYSSSYINNCGNAKYYGFFGLKLIENNSSNNCSSFSSLDQLNSITNINGKYYFLYEDNVNRTSDETFKIQ